jgi:hypothetical protein
MRGLTLILAILAPAVTCAADPLPQGAVLRLGETRFRAGGEIRHLRFSHDGKVMLGWVIGPDGALDSAAWDVSTGESVSPLENHTPPDVPERTTPAARLTGDRVVTAGPGCAGRIWDASTGRQLAVLSGHSAPVTSVAVSQDGKRIATASKDGLIRLWDADTFHPLAGLGGHTGRVRTIRVTNNGSRAVTVGDDRSVRVWDLKNGKELRGFPSTGPVDLSQDGTSIVMARGDEPVVRDVLTGLEVIPIHEPTQPNLTLTELLARIGVAMAFSPDGRMVAIGHGDGKIGLYETATGRRRRLLAGRGSPCNAVVFTPDGTRLLAAEGHTVLVWAVGVQDLPLNEEMRHERKAGKLWTMLTTGSAEEAYLAMARFAAEPPAAVKMSRMQLQSAEIEESTPGERLAQTRAVELLESVGTPAAREFLEELAVGEPNAHLTHEAWRALERLGKKK